MADTGKAVAAAAAQESEELANKVRFVALASLGALMRARPAAKAPSCATASGGLGVDRAAAGVLRRGACGGGGGGGGGGGDAAGTPPRSAQQHRPAQAMTQHHTLLEPWGCRVQAGATAQEGAELGEAAACPVARKTQQDEELSNALGGAAEAPSTP